MANSERPNYTGKSLGPNEMRHLVGVMIGIVKSDGTPNVQPAEPKLKSGEPRITDCA